MTDEEKTMLDDLVTDFCRRAQLYGCDAVQVLLSVHDEAAQQTNVLKEGRGNWYARQALCREFIEEDTARTSNYVRVTEFGEDG